MCKGKKIFVPSSADTFREAFGWKKVGVLPLSTSLISNSNTFAFTDLEKWKDQKTQPVPFETFLRFAEFSREDKKEPAKTKSKLKLTPPQGLSLTSSLLSGLLNPSQPFKVDNYELVSAIQYPLQYFNPYELSSALTNTPNYDFVQQPTGFQVLPISLAGLQAPFSSTDSSYSSLKSPSSPFSQIFRQNPSAASGSSPFLYAYPYLSYLHNTYPQLFSGEISGFKGSSPNVYSPNLFSTSSKYPSKPFTQTKSPFGSLSTQVGYSKPVSASPYDLFTYNPGQIKSQFNLGGSRKPGSAEQTKPLPFKEQTFIDPTTKKSYTFLFDPLVSQEGFFQSRNEGEEGYNFIPLTDEDIISLIEYSIKSQSSPLNHQPQT